MVLLHYGFLSDLVVLSFGISFLGAYIAISLCEQLRQSMLDDKRIHGMRTKISHRKNHLLLLFLMSLSVSGVGIWSMHFIGMHALMVYDQNGHIVQMQYNVTLSVLSFICVLFTTFVGMTTASYDVMFSKEKQEIMEQLISDAKNWSLHEIRKIDYKKLLLIISTKRLGRLILGGVITGSGVSIMHYIGMVAMVFDGRIIWNPFIVFLSVVIAIVASTAAFWILFRFLSIFPELEYLRLLSALIMGIAVCGMHYTGMTAASFEMGRKSDAVGQDLRRHNMHSNESYAGALIGANLMLWVIAMYMIWSYRRVCQQQASLLQNADQIAQYVIADSPQHSSTFGTSGTITHGDFQSKPVSNTPIAPSSASADHIRHIAEQYMIKRYRPSSLLSFRNKKKPGHRHYHTSSVLSPTSGSSHHSDTTTLPQQIQQAHVSFSHFLCFFIYWAITGHWDIVQYICCVDSFDDPLTTRHSANLSSEGDGRLSAETLDRNQVSSSNAEMSCTQWISTQIHSYISFLSPSSAMVFPDSFAADIEAADSTNQAQPCVHQSHSTFLVESVVEEEEGEVLVALTSSKKNNDSQSFTSDVQTLSERKVSVSGQHFSTVQVFPTSEREEEEENVTNLYLTSVHSTSGIVSVMNDEIQNGDANHSRNVVKALENIVYDFDARSIASSPRGISRNSSHLSSEYV